MAYSTCGSWGRYNTTLYWNQNHINPPKYLVLGKRSGCGTEFFLGNDQAEQLKTVDELIATLQALQVELQKP